LCDEWTIQLTWNFARAPLSKAMVSKEVG